MQDEELLRYSRQIMMPDIDIAGQEKLRDAHVMIVGVGGLGSPAALYLAAAGVGQLTLIDDDQVELTNLQRQIVHDTAALGEAKVLSAQRRLNALNPHVSILPHAVKADPDTLAELLDGCDLVLDCTDNFTIRFQLNQLTWQHKVPLVSAAGIGWEGHISVFDANNDQSPCYQCLYQEGDDAALNCAENGVIAPLVGILGTTQAMEAIKLITGVGEPLIGRVLYLDAKYMEWRTLKLSRLQNCPCCG